MKKTLKLLMAITLFVAILAIATGVNAATLSKLETDGDIAKDTTAGAATNAYTVSAALAKEVDISENAVITAGANITGTITVNSGVTTLKSSAASNITKVVVKSGATLIIDGADLTVAAVVNEGGTVKAKSATAVTKVSQNSTAKTYAVAAGNVKAVETTGTDATKTYNAYTLKEETTDGYTTIYLSDADIKVEVKFKDDELGVVNTLEKDKKYTWEAKAYTKNDNKELSDVVKLVKTTDTDKDYATFSGTDNAVVTFAADSEIFAEVGTNKGKVAIAVKLGEVKVTPTPTATPSEAPATTAPATDAPNKGDKDETPKTGDQIIPATALLAVVVVANVVYFAKSKRS